jgi:hypothetical protein
VAQLYGKKTSDGLPKALECTDDGELKISGFYMRTTDTSTGTGSEQTIAHLLGVIPKAVNVVPTGTSAVVPAYRADATNIYVTMPLGEPYTWSAEA